MNFDDQGQTIGEAQALLAGFLGTLAADCKLFPWIMIDGLDLQAYLKLILMIALKQF